MANGRRSNSQDAPDGLIPTAGKLRLCTRLSGRATESIISTQHFRCRRIPAIRSSRSVSVAMTRLTLATVLMTAASCIGSIDRQETAVFEAADRVEAGLVSAGGGSSSAEEPPAKRPEGAVQVSNAVADDNWKLRKFEDIQFRSGIPLDLQEVINRIASMTGIQLLVLSGPEGDPTAASGSGSEGIEYSNLSQVQIVRKLEESGLGARFRPNYRGPLVGMLDKVAARYGLDWKYDGTSIVFRQFSTRTHLVAALPSRTEFSGTVGSAETSGSIDLTGEISDAIRSLAGDDGRVVQGRSSGHFLVTARPENQRRIEEYIRELNDYLGRQVAFDVNVLTVTLSETESVGLDLDLLASDGDGEVAVRWTGMHGLAGSTGSINVGVLGSDVELDLFVGALARRGRVAVETRTGATTSNNRMVPVQVVSETAYAKKVEAVSGSQGNTRTTIEPGTLKTGFELNLLPRLLPVDRILLSFSIKLSDLNELVEFTSDRQTIQLPRVSTTSFEQQAIIGDDQTLVLMGFERNRLSHDRSGAGGFPALFGGRGAATTDRIATVLMIRPRILPVGGGSRSIESDREHASAD